MAEMTDFERAADLLARCVPIGLGSSEERQRTEALIDQLAAEVLHMDRSEASPDGLRALILRQQERLEQQAMRLAGLKSRIEALETDVVMADTERLLVSLREVKKHASEIDALGDGA